jgi:SAM-dependent methyltransferase
VPTDLTCRLCGNELRHSFADLGASPLANAFLELSELGGPERFYPLHAYVCDECFLVQLPVFESPEEIFGDYVYFSSYSDSWVDHARRYAERAIARFHLRPSSSVIEIASNDGYLLQFFQARGIPVLGVEPAENVAEAARTKGIPTLVKFFGEDTAEELVEDGAAPDLVVANNVLAHVPDLNDFVAGLAVLLAPGGAATLEFPHLLRLIEECEFDTIYHEHFSYFSLGTVEQAFAVHGLEIFDVEELSTHGGSLRIYARAAGSEPPSPAVAELKERELDAGLRELDTYTRFEERVREAKRALLEFLISAKREGSAVVAYGAAAKGNTLLNYCGIRSDFIDYVVDRSPHKQGLYLPGTHLRVFAPERVAETKPDYLLILPWNISAEVMEQMAHVREFGCRFVTPIPSVTVHE